MINKSFLIGGLLLSTALFSKADGVIFSCDFEGGIPSSFATYDLDMNQPSRSMKKYGFSQGVAWVGYTENADSENENSVAYSGSWYTEVAPSNDWMITPAISIDDKRSILGWKAYALDADRPDGYSVFISESGNSPEDFKDEPVFTVSGENSYWTLHTLSLEKWVGKDIYIAFVNNSEDCNLLAVDDITVFAHEHSFNFENNTPEAIPQPGVAKVCGSIESSGFVPLEGYKIELIYDGNSYTIDESETIVEAGKSVDFEFDVDINVEFENTVDYQLIISSLNGADVMTVNGSISCFKHLLVVEESTGTWCGWCPGGQYNIGLLHEKYPNDFISIAVHLGDEMEVDEYSQNMRKYFNGIAPFCSVNRNVRYLVSPNDDEMESTLLDAMQEGAIGKIDCEAVLNGENKIEFTATAEFGKNLDDNYYNLQVVVVEDKMTGSAQANYYAGGSIEMGGLENLKDPIPKGEYLFANVGRAIYPSFGGDSEAFSVGTERHTPINISRIYDLPQGIQNLENVKIVALIIDNETSEIVNACQTSLKDSSVDQIDNVASIKVQSAPNGITVLSNDEIKCVELWNLSGGLMTRAIPNANVYNLNVSKGVVALLKVVTDTTTVVRKVVL